MVQDFPDEARFLSSAEREVILYRLAKDKQASSKHEDFDKRYAFASLKDWKTYCFAIIYMGCDGALYAFSLFTPTIISGLGYSGTTANLLSVPPYACAAIATVFIGWLADRTKQRGLCNIGISIIGIAGFIMLLASQANGVKYAGVFLGAVGIYPWYVTVTQDMHEKVLTLTHQHRQHHRLDLQQYRRRLQTRCDDGHRHRLGQSQRYRRIEHLPSRGQAGVLRWAWCCAGLSVSVLILW